MTNQEPSTSGEREPTERTALRRHPERGLYDRESINAILDEGLVCHVGFVAGGRPFVIPTGYARIGENIYFHGAATSRLMTTVGESIDICVTVTLLDGLVLARSAFSHSMNYRSVVVFGRARIVADTREKLEVLRAFSEHVMPGRWDEVRRPNREELNETMVLALPLTEASAKVRTGAPKDKEEDYESGVWAGVVPLMQVAGAPVDDEMLREGTDVPRYVREYCAEHWIGL